MHKVWEAESATTLFWKRLIRERAVEFMRSPDYLRALRHRNDQAREDQKRFGHIWEEYGTNVYQLIAEACGETWDEEDDAKCPAAEERHAKKEAAVNQKEAIASDDDLVATREASACERVDELQGKRASASWKKQKKGAKPKKGKKKAAEKSSTDEPEAAAPIKKKRRKRAKRAMPKIPAEVYKSVDSRNL